MRRVVVTGAGRGLGLEFCRRYLAQGDAVVATVRRPSSDALTRLSGEYPGRLHVATFDVRDSASVLAFAQQLSSLAVDLLINNAGAIGPETHKGELGQSLGSMNAEVLRELFEVNAVAPLLLTSALVPSFKMVSGAKVVVLGSTIGCASETFGDYYAYRMSKAAAHIAFATLARDFAAYGILAAVLCPGWVRTDMGGPSAPLAVEESVGGMMRVIEDLDKSKSGSFLDYSGRVLSY